MKPRFRKTKRIREHVGKPLDARGWKPAKRWIITLHRFNGSMSWHTSKDFLKARKLANELLEKSDWEYAWIKEGT